MNFDVEFYETDDGKTPVEDFLSAIEPKMRAKMVSLMGLLEEKGTSLREPYTKHLENGIFELRCRFSGNISRALFFFYIEGKIIITNGFIKKTQKTPQREIQLAKERREDYLRRERKYHEKSEGI